MKSKIYIANLLLFISIFIYYNLAGFDESELLILLGCIFGFHLFHFIFIKKIKNADFLYFGLYMCCVWFLITLQALLGSFIGYYLTLSLVVAIEVFWLAYILKSFFENSTASLISKLSTEEKKAMKEKLILAKEHLEKNIFPAFFEVMSQIVIGREKGKLSQLKDNFLDNGASIDLRNRCEVLRNDIVEKIQDTSI